MVSSGLIIFITSVLILVVLALVAWLFVIMKGDNEIKEEKNFGINFADFDERRAYGNVHKIDPTEGNRHKITLHPRDLSLETINKKKEVKPVKFVVGKGKIVTLPKGTWSGEKHIQIFLPQYATDFPDEIKSSAFGKMLQFYTEVVNSDETQVEALLEGIERQKAYITKMGDGEATLKMMDYFEGFTKDAVDLLKDGRKDKSTGFNAPGFGAPGQ